MGALDWKAMLKGFAAYWVMSAPIYSPWRLTLKQPLSEAITWLPYLAAFVAGLAYALTSTSNRDRDCIVLGLLIGLSVGLVNLAGPLIGFQSDLPGLKYSALIAVVAAVVSVVLVLAGAASRGFFGGREKRT
jgi:hypothetical protein